MILVCLQIVVSFGSVSFLLPVFGENSSVANPVMGRLYGLHRFFVWMLIVPPALYVHNTGNGETSLGKRWIMSSWLKCIVTYDSW